MKYYQTSEVAQLSGLSLSRVRALARAGCVGQRHGRQFRFAFHDLVLARTAHYLLQEGCRLKDVSAALKSLAATGEADGSRVRLRAEGRDVVVERTGTLFSVISGQGHLDFSLSAVAAVLAPQAIQLAAKSSDTAADDWFDLACDLETAGTIDQAIVAFAKAAEADPSCADAHVNLGRLHAAKQDPRTATVHYRKAVAIDPGNAVAWFNWGVLRQEQGEAVEAIDAYRKALAIDPDLADAHYNLASLLESIDRQSAFRHLSTYKRLSVVR
jgi:Tfp pilus assembly protein PilF